MVICSSFSKSFKILLRYGCVKHRSCAALLIEVKGGKAAGMRLVNSLKMAVIAVSLGDAETLVQHPASMTHSAYSAEELKEAGIPEGLVRISVGLEDSEDIIADFRQAFAQV